MSTATSAMAIVASVLAAENNAPAKRVCSADNDPFDVEGLRLCSWGASGLTRRSTMSLSLVIRGTPTSCHARIAAIAQEIVARFLLTVEPVSMFISPLSLARRGRSGDTAYRLRLARALRALLPGHGRQHQAMARRPEVTLARPGCNPCFRRGVHGRAA
jgi:hypothetical protein